MHCFDVNLDRYIIIFINLLHVSTYLRDPWFKKHPKPDYTIYNNDPTVYYASYI
jgi:hypothetical protein